MRTRNNGTIRRAGWTWLAALALTGVAYAEIEQGPPGGGGGGGGQAAPGAPAQAPAYVAPIIPTGPINMAPTNAKVEVSTISPKDPHPTVYSWDGKVENITQPKTYYTFYYTGSVQPDARVPEDSVITRVPVKLSEWADNKRWIVAQLTTFYQQANNMPVTALLEYGAGPAPAMPTAPGAPAPQAQQPPTGQQPQMSPQQGLGGGQFGGQQAAPRQQQFRSDEPQESQDGGPGIEQPQDDNQENVAPPQGGGGGNVIPMPGVPNPGNLTSAFDPRAAAEWTFYYDQLVLWQYYCARNLLRGQDQTLLETLPPRGNPQQQQMLINQVSGMTPQMLRSTTVRQSQRMIQNAQSANPYQPSYAGVGPLESEGDMGGGMMNTGGFGMGNQQMQQPVTLLRETFDPLKDYQSQTSGVKSTGDEYRDKFIEAAKQLDEQIYTIYMEMLKGIDKRQATNESYEKWIKDKRQEVTNYAETWRKLEHGETIMIDGTMFLVSKDPLESVPNQTINVIKRERLTPADLLNTDGTVRSAEK